MSIAHKFPPPFVTICAASQSSSDARVNVYRVICVLCVISEHCGDGTEGEAMLVLLVSVHAVQLTCE